MRHSHLLATPLCSVLALLFCCAPAFAVEPSIRAINIRGLQIGGTTELVCDGDDLTTEPRLLLPFAAHQELKSGSTEKKATFIVKLADDVQPGYYQLRIATAGGVSLPIVIGIDRLLQQELKNPIEKLPVAAHGSVGGSAISETKFPGKKGEPVTIEIEAQRLGSKLRPVLHLYDSKGKQLAWAWSQPALFGDARLETTLPEDGEYRVTCHDLEYAAPSPNFFRLKIGRWERVDQVIPAAVTAGTSNTSIRVYSQDSNSLQSVTANEGSVQRLATPSNFSGPRPFVRVTSQRELVENISFATTAESLTAGPLTFHGELLQPNEEDCYTLAVKAGDKIRCEVIAQRQGSVVDAEIVIRNDKGAVLGAAADSPGSLDPLLEYAVPDKVELIRICVIDSQGRGGLRSAYQLSLRNLNDTATTSTDFRLLSNLERTAISKGGRWVAPFWIDRRGYQGAIELSASGLPAGLTLAGTTIPAGSSGTLVTFTADEAETTADKLAAITQWQGKTADGQTQPVLLKNHPLETLQPWLAEEIAIARVNSPAADFSVEWRDLPDTAALQPTAKLALPIKITRTDDKTAVRLSLVSSQLVTLNNNQPDPTKTLRVERAVEVGAKMNEGEVSVLVPQDLAEDAYDLAVQAELLSADKQKVLATSFTPVRRLPVQMPVEGQLVGETKIDVMLDPAKGAMQKIEGTIKRREGITGDVVVALAGLPTGVRADSPTVKADATTFTVTVTLPPAQLVGELTGLKLSATIAPDPKQANARVKSREVELKLNVLRPTP